MTTDFILKNATPEELANAGEENVIAMLHSMSMGCMAKLKKHRN